MKKKLFIALAVAFCLGAGALVAGNVSGVSVLNVKDVESLASCEVFDKYGNQIGGCYGSEDRCWVDNMSCSGKKY